MLILNEEKTIGGTNNNNIVSQTSRFYDIFYSVVNIVNGSSVVNIVNGMV